MTKARAIVVRGPIAPLERDIWAPSMFSTLSQEGEVVHVCTWQGIDVAYIMFPDRTAWWYPTECLSFIGLLPGHLPDNKHCAQELPI